jgi:hypothetical protein
LLYPDEKALTTKVTKDTKKFCFILTYCDKYFAANKRWLELFRKPLSVIPLKRVPWPKPRPKILDACH